MVDLRPEICMNHCSGYTFPASNELKLPIIDFSGLSCAGDEHDGAEYCEGELVARHPTATYGEVYSGGLLCLPVLACGTDFGAECCTDDPPCFGADSFGTSLGCVDGTCTRCGLRGTMPCDGVLIPHIIFLLC